MGSPNAGKGGSDGYNGPDAGFVNTGPSKLSKKNIFLCKPIVLPCPV